MKYALVTGSGQGIGKAIAEELEKNNYIVIRNGLSKRKDVKNYIKADLSTKEGINFLTRNVGEITDKLDCIVLNVGTTCRKSFQELTYDDWDFVMRTNVIMPSMLVQSLNDLIREGGNVIFIGSMLSVNAQATSIPYGVSKAAINILSKSLAREFADKRIRVNTICPGFVETNWQKEKPEWLKEKIIQKTALKRFAKPEEIAHMCMSVCENSFMNGSVVFVDGGYDLVY